MLFRSGPSFSADCHSGAPGDPPYEPVNLHRAKFNLNAHDVGAMVDHAFIRTHAAGVAVTRNVSPLFARSIKVFSAARAGFQRARGTREPRTPRFSFDQKSPCIPRAIHPDH